MGPGPKGQPPLVRQLEHLHELVRAAGGQERAVRARTRRRTPCREWPPLMSATSLPVCGEDLDLAVLGGCPAAGGEELAVRGVRDAGARVGEAADAVRRACPSRSPTGSVPGSCRWRASCRRARTPSTRRARCAAAFAALPSGVLSSGSTSVALVTPTPSWSSPFLSAGVLRLEDVDWLPRLAATDLPSGATATARTGFTSAGGRLTMIFSFARVVVGAFAPSSIHSLTSESSCDVSGSSVLGGMIGFICRLHARNRKLSADLPGHDDLRAALRSALHDLLVGAHVELALGHVAGVADEALVLEDRLDVRAVLDRRGPLQVDGRDGGNSLSFLAPGPRERH